MSLSFIGSYYNSGLLKLGSLVMLPFMIYELLKGRHFSRKLLLQMCFFAIPIFVFMIVTPILASYKAGSFSASYVFSGERQLVYQMLCILAVGAALYVLEGRAILGTAIAAILAGIYAIINSLLKFGVQSSLDSVKSFALSAFSSQTNVDGFVADLEMHDYTFMLGILILFLAFHEKKHFLPRILSVLSMTALFVLGYCRIAYVALVVCIILELLRLLVKRCSSTAQHVWIFTFLCVFAVVAFVYVRMIFNGTLKLVFDNLQIQANGRSSWWFDDIAEKIKFSVNYIGGGIGYCKSLFNVDIHNDMLRQFVDIGFIGFVAWLVYVFVLQPVLISKFVSVKNLWRYLICTIFIFITYMSDNTMFYYNTTYVYYLICMIVSMTKIDYHKHEKSKLNEITT